MKVLIMSMISSAVLASAGAELKIDFSRGKWAPEKWLTFKSMRWDYVNDFEQADDHIVNRAPKDVSDEELYKKHVCDVYSSIVYPEKLSGSFEVASTMSFDHLMAPLIVLTPELDKDEKGRYVFKRHFEVVLYNEGINVWHYRYDANGKLTWYLAAFARAKFDAKTKYELKVKVQKGKFNPRMTIECGDVRFGYESPELVGELYAGITGCEGRNRFYDFTLRRTNEKFDAAADGEH